MKENEYLEFVKMNLSPPCQIKRPEPPVYYSEKNWRCYSDYKMAQQAYYNALAIYEMFEREGK